MVKVTNRTYALFIKASKILFFKFGYRRVTIEDICKEASLSKMSFYRYFKNKEEIANITLKNIIAECNRSFESIMECDAPFLKKIQDLVILNNNYTEQIGLDFINDVFSLKKNSFKTIIENQYGYERKKLTDCFKKAQKKGELNRKTPVAFLIYMLDDLREKMIDENLKKIYSDEKDMWLDLTDFYFFGISPKNQKVQSL